ncbi:hypothetical protein [Streptomyces spectabilis]|uniref:Uncharacterized protein n=1 Tax=Streptomyces spectabilis TaxID=68270 RepID=A0A516RJY3_STRST|nr:hypothetical protein [Streptomyces spectabilis]QDQ15953.1 hypothetical protein FH965_39875 [Streptomyces spectabilis]
MHDILRYPMIDSSRPERIREFSPAQYIAPYLLLTVGGAGVQKAPVSDRPVLFWIFTAIVALGALSAAVRLKRMWTTHQRRHLPAWTGLLGLFLALYGLCIAYYVIDHIAG